MFGLLIGDANEDVAGGAVQAIADSEQGGEPHRTDLPLSQARNIGRSMSGKLNEVGAAHTAFLHELTELEGKISNVNNYCIAVKEKGDDIVFLRKIVKGGADKSYGIQVAKLAGVPNPVINRAKEIVEELVTADITGKVKDIAVQGSETKKKTQKKLDEVDLTQFSLFDTVKDDDVLNELKELDISHMTPMDAMNKLYQLQNKLRNRW